MDRLKRWNDRFIDWQLRHPRLATILYGGIFGILSGSSNHSVLIGLLAGGLFASMYRFDAWPRMQRRRQNPTASQRKPWEVALVGGVVAGFVALNLMIIIFGIDVGFAMAVITIGVTFLVGIITALLLYRWRAHS